MCLHFFACGAFFSLLSWFQFTLDTDFTELWNFSLLRSVSVYPQYGISVYPVKILVYPEQFTHFDLPKFFGLSRANFSLLGSVYPIFRPTSKCSILVNWNILMTKPKNLVIFLGKPKFSLTKDISTWLEILSGIRTNK